MGNVQSLLNSLVEDVEWQLPEMKTCRLSEHGMDGNKSDNSSAQLFRRKMLSNLSQRTLLRRATKWLYWVVSRSVSNLRAKIRGSDRELWTERAL